MVKEQNVRIFKANRDLPFTDHHCFPSKMEGFYSYSGKLDFSQLAEVVKEQNFVKVFLPFRFSKTNGTASES